MLVPPNIFQALYQGLALQIVFFSIIFGIALGSIRSEASDLIINIMLSVLETFQRLVAWSLYGLPFALVCLIATQVASVGVEIFSAMLKFTVLFWLVGAVLFVVSTLVIWLRSGVPQSPARAPEPVRPDHDQLRDSVELRGLARVYQRDAGRPALRT